MGTVTLGSTRCPETLGTPRGTEGTMDGNWHELKRAPSEWGPWRLNQQNYTLIERRYGYEVDLERCLTSEAVLDWICQIAGKTWPDYSWVSGLVYAFDDLLHPQGTMCGGGLANAKARKMTNTQLKERVTNYRPGRVVG